MDLDLVCVERRERPLRAGGEGVGRVSKIKQIRQRPVGQGSNSGGAREETKRPLEKLGCIFGSPRQPKAYNGPESLNAIDACKRSVKLYENGCKCVPWSTGLHEDRVGRGVQVPTSEAGRNPSGFRRVGYVEVRDDDGRWGRRSSILCVERRDSEEETRVHKHIQAERLKRMRVVVLPEMRVCARREDKEGGDGGGELQYRYAKLREATRGGAGDEEEKRTRADGIEGLLEGGGAFGFEAKMGWVFLMGWGSEMNYEMRGMEWNGKGENGRPSQIRASCPGSRTDDRPPTQDENRQIRQRKGRFGRA
ncbi:hypothetical protein FA13DRAFT_1715245 [Coprinellus micaceus]|uniref:Uncharacterized protein n=1 Tax=Coprinellus micaceus TaxID=71717 RepID=A0A4Y7SPL4_COPMI|nr:hypothetical protein FA13DRAFT_1715245 [Coprinellus micaceus]